MAQDSKQYDSKQNDSKQSIREERIRKITHLYYSNPEIQKVMFNFSQNREVCPRYFEGFGKRPDSLQYPSDIFELVKKGATSFHCSEEIWDNPLNITTGMDNSSLNKLRLGWDLLIDIDCPWIEGSKYAAISIIKVLKKHGINSISIKFSGSKGFHILVPFKCFPKEIAGEKIKDLFPDLPRKLVAYLRFESGKELAQNLPEEFLKSVLKNTSIKRGIQCNSCNEIAKEYELVDLFCPKCKIGEQKRMILGSDKKIKCANCINQYIVRNTTPIYICDKCKVDSIKNPSNFSTTTKTDLFELMGLDLVLVSPRHLFRMPYSLHEKTALASIVLDIEDLENFDLSQANPMNIKIKDFMPNVKEGEAKEFVTKALDWYSSTHVKEESVRSKVSTDFKPIKIIDKSDKNFPPCIKKILLGVNDGKKRSLFALINFFRMIQTEQQELDLLLYEWNKKNNPPLQQSYITTQINWAFKKNPIMPPNCKEFYQGLGVCEPDNMCNVVKNPVNYIARKNFKSSKSPKNKDNFKNND